MHTNDENVAPTSLFLPNKMKSANIWDWNLASKVSSKFGWERQVLGNIGNIRQTSNEENKMVKRVRAANFGETTEAAVFKLADVLGEVDLTPNDTSLEAGIAKLKLNAVDAADVGDAQMVSEYINDIMAHLKEVEPRRQPSASYMSRQGDINAAMREILIDWLVEEHFKFKLCDETLYLTVSIISLPRTQSGVAYKASVSWLHCHADSS